MGGSGAAAGVGSRYDGFISYSHAADDLLAPRLQAGLQAFAQTWWRRRALRIFRDQSSLSANPHLWTSITSALEGSDWFVLLTSPEAAASPWVDRESPGSGTTLKGHVLSALPVDFGTAGLCTSGLEGFDANSGAPILSTVRWDQDPERLAVVACQLVGRNLTQAEWAEYVPDAEYRATCPQFPSGE